MQDSSYCSIRLESFVGLRSKSLRFHVGKVDGMMAPLFHDSKKRWLIGSWKIYREGVEANWLRTQILEIGNE
jgi:hypothetical protein